MCIWGLFLESAHAVYLVKNLITPAMLGPHGNLCLHPREVQGQFPCHTEPGHLTFCCCSPSLPEWLPKHPRATLCRTWLRAPCPQRPRQEGMWSLTTLRRWARCCPHCPCSGSSHALLLAGLRKPGPQKIAVGQVLIMPLPTGTVPSEVMRHISQCTDGELVCAAFGKERLCICMLSHGGPREETKTLREEQNCAHQWWL